MISIHAQANGQTYNSRNTRNMQSSREMKEKKVAQASRERTFYNEA